MPSTTKPATGPPTRTRLLDAAERLLLREGYAAVTSRRVAAEAGVTAQLVHYHFGSMDDLYLEVYRRRAEEGFERLRTAMEVHPSLRTVWRFGVDRFGPAFSLEFVALANHRKAIRDEIARTAERFRNLQLEAITTILRDRGVSTEVYPPIVVLLAMNGMSQAIAIEEALGITSGHDQMLRFVEGWIDEAERELAAPAGLGRRSEPAVDWS
jgi:TetR/AcrR family transcriptional regulator